MIVLDENIIDPQRRQLDAWKIHVRQISVDIGRRGMDDREEIIPLLHSLRRPTFFTRDQDFFHPWLRHPGYCLVFLEIQSEETALYIRRFLPSAFSHAVTANGQSRPHSRKRCPILAA